MGFFTGDNNWSHRAASLCILENYSYATVHRATASRKTGPSRSILVIFECLHFIYASVNTPLLSVDYLLHESLSGFYRNLFDIHRMSIFINIKPIHAHRQIYIYVANLSNSLSFLCSFLCIVSIMHSNVTA